VDITCDAILGRDFLEHTGAQICYASGTLTLGTGSSKVSKMPINAENQTRRVRILVLPSRTELMVRLPVKEGTHVREGITKKQEIQEGVYLAGGMTRVQACYTITSIANTKNEKVEIDAPVFEVAEVEPGNEENPQERDVSDKH